MFGPVITSMRRASVELEVVRHEGIVEHAFDDRVPAALDAKTRLVGKLRLHVTQADCALGEVREHVGERERRGHALQRPEFRDQAVEEAFEQFPLARERAVAAAEHLVLELLELGRDVALGVLDGLPPLVVERGALGLAPRQLDVVAVHAVVGDLELRDARPAALALLELEQVPVGAGRDRAQFVERRIKARGDDAAFAQERRRRADDRATQEVVEFRLRRKVLRGGGEQGRLEPGKRRLKRRQEGESLAQRREVARPRRAQRDAREHALDVADAAQQFVQAVVAIGLDQGGDGAITAPQGFTVTQGPADPAPQFARAHGSRRAVNDACERRRPRARRGSCRARGCAASRHPSRAPRRAIRARAT